MERISRWGQMRYLFYRGKKRPHTFQWAIFRLNGQKAKRGAEITPNYQPKSLIVKGFTLRTLPEWRPAGVTV